MPNGRITQISKKYIDKLALRNIDKEADDLYKHIDELLTKAGEKHRANMTFAISMPLLRVAIQSYYLDIFRYADFHPYDERGKHLNCYKKAAVFCKWFLKISPILFVKLEGEGDADFIVQVNSVIALEYSLALSQIHTGKLTNNTKERLIYNFIYRDFNDSMYTFLLEAWAET